MGEGKSGHDVPEFVSVNDVAHTLHVHRRTVLRLIHTGEIPAVRIGRQWRISPDAVRPHERKRDDRA